MSTPRARGTKVTGGGWSEETLDEVFRKATPFSGSGRDEVRLDRYRSRIRRGSHGSHTTEGWEVDHIKPVAKGGKDDMDNLQPLQWQNNAEKADTPGHGIFPVFRNNP